MRTPGILLALALLLSSTPVAAADDPAEAIFGRAEAAISKGDRVGLDQARTEIDGLLSSNPQSSLAHYVRGWILSKQGRADESVAAYDEALRLSPDLSDAAYNAGVVLMGAGREAEAVAHFEKAAGVDPDYVDAHYNLGQAYYNRGDFAKALAAWQRSLELVPGDFQAAKKIVQAYHGLGDDDGAARARTKLIEIWKTSTDPQVRQLKEFVFDQFQASGRHVMAAEVFEKPEDHGFLYRFVVIGADGETLGSIRLEPGVGFENSGVAYIIGIEKGTRLWTPGPGFDSLPDYDKLKPIVLAAIAREFPPQ